MDLLAFLSIETINNWISTGGYFVLFGLLFACGLGLPLPEDVPLIIAGAAISQGKMSWLVAAICAWCGIIGGDVVLYHLGKKLGPGVSKLPFIGKHVTTKRFNQVERLFQQYGVGVIAVGRLLAGIRGAMVVCAGAIRYNFITFIIADGLAALVSGGLWMLLGHWLGKKLLDPAGQAFIHRFKEYFAIGAIAAVIGVVVWIVWRKRHATEVLNTEVKIVEKVSEVAAKIPHPHLPAKAAHEPSSAADSNVPSSTDRSAGSP